MLASMSSALIPLKQVSSKRHLQAQQVLTPRRHDGGCATQIFGYPSPTPFGAVPVAIRNYTQAEYESNSTEEGP